MEVLTEAHGTIISQRKYTYDLLHEVDVSHLPPVSSPLDPAVKLTQASSDFLADSTVYRHLVGKLNYLTHTRPDLCHAIVLLSQFLQRPSMAHYNAALRVVNYLRCFPDHGLFFSSSPSFTLTAFCDADWASCRDSRRSISGFFISLGGSPISWKSKKQASISLSSAEAEYRSMRHLVVELTWLTRLLTDLSVPPLLPVPVHFDCQAAIHIARNPVFHERTKHVELDCHFVRQQFLSGLISLHFVPSQNHLADIFTKPLSGPVHHELLRKLRGDVEKSDDATSSSSSPFSQPQLTNLKSKKKGEHSSMLSEKDKG